MSPEEIEKKLIGEFATILGKDPAAIEADTPLHSLGVDSLGLVEVLVFIEKTFSLNLMESGLSKKDFKTIGSLAGCIEKELRH
jgi:acyl carrier protein